MYEENIHTRRSILGLTQDLLESRDREVVQTRLEELKGIAALLSSAQRARYARYLGKAAKLTALEELKGQAIEPVSQAAFQALEELEARATQLPFLFREEGLAKQPVGEDLEIIAAHIGTADAPETIQTATSVLLDTVSAQDGLCEQTLYCAYGRRLMEDKILLETLHLHTSPALSLWDSLRRSPSEALAISLLWYDRETGIFCSAAPEVLASLDTPEELWKVLAFYEAALQLAPLQERILCQRELCRCILRQASSWLMEQGLDKEPLFRLFTQVIRQYLWGDLSLLNWGNKDRDNLIPPLVLRLSGALDERNIPVPPVFSRLLKLCIAVAMDYGDPSLTQVLKEGEGQ